MNIPSSNPERADRDLAEHALRIDREALRGPSPDLWEIERFRQGDLSPTRRSEVLSHLAHDPQTFALLQELEQAENAVAILGLRAGWWRRVAQTGGQLALRTWEAARLPALGHREGTWRRGAVFATILTSAFVAVLLSWLLSSDPLERIEALDWQTDLAQVPPPEAWPWWPAIQHAARKAVQPSFGSRAGARPADRAEPASRTRTSLTPPEAQAFRAGVVDALKRLIGSDRRWTPWLAALHNERPQCRNGESGCIDKVAAGAAVGRWTTFIAWRCQFDSAADAAFWNDQDRLRLSLAKELSGKAPAVAAALQDWQGESSHSRLCDGADVLLSTVLSR